MEDIKFVDIQAEGIDEKNFAYALCDCSPRIDYVIRISKKR